MCIRDSDYAVPAKKKLTVEVRDPNDTLIYSASKITDRFGCYHGEFNLNRESATGTYTLVTTLAEGDLSRDSEHAATFQVAAYAKPEFAVKVTFPKKRYIRGEIVQAKIKAEYYFGAPVANARVSYTIQRSDYWLYEGEDGQYDYDSNYEDYGGYGEWVEEGELTTDENGEAVVSFPAVWPEPREEYGWDNDQLFNVEVSVTDTSRREAFGSGEVIATRGEFAVYVEPDRYVVQPSSRVKVNIRTVSYRKRPVSNKRVTLIIGREYWTGRELEFREIERKTVETDASGRASVDFLLKIAGDVRVVGVAHDRRGNRVTGSAWIWCWNEAYEEVEGVRYPELKIVTDKKSYMPGETAKVLINTASPGRTALVTIEGEKIYERMVISVKGKSTTIDIPVRESYKPNFYVGVCFVRQKRFIHQEERVKVSIVPQTINISIEPNKTRYLPGETATYKLKTTDSKGQPVNAQLSLGVVDEAIYAISPDTTEPILDYFYYRKPNVVSTQFSFPEIYLSDPDKAGMSANMPRQTKMRIRKRFLDTAFWKPNIMTGPSGEATISFKMPDNLTTWRATVRAVTMDTKCGQATNTVLAQQDMIVRLETPRFLVQDDLTTISAVVHNYTGSEDRVEVSFEAPGLSVEGETRRSITVADQGSERIDWTVRAPKAGEFLITVRAKGTEASDAMQLAIPVYPHGDERRSIHTGALIEVSKDSMIVSVRNDSIPEATRLVIRLAPSLASAMLGSLDYLAQYPYGCTEQTMSSFLPDVIMWRSFNDLGIRNPKLRAKLPEMVQTGLLRLYRFQMEDGGWGWCEYGKSDPWMTAYVCYGLLQAKEAGFQVNADVVARGLKRLSRVLDADNRKADRVNEETMSWACYVFALAGSDMTEQLENLASNRRLSPRALAIISLAFSELGRTALATETARRLFSTAAVEPAFVHWTGYNDYEGGDIETTALALRAVLKVDSTDPLIPKIVAWLMNQRRGNCWFSTRDTAMTIYAMAEFLKVTKELRPDYVAEVRLNGKLVASYRFTSNSIFEPDLEIAISPRDVRKGRNEITITKTGRGNLYYAAILTQWVARKQIAATVTGAGISITRAYYKPGSQFYQQGNVSALGSPIRSCSSGDVIYVRLTVNSARPLNHLLLEDFIPAGCEIVDRGRVDYWEWDYWYVGRDIRDEKICFYLDRLGRGKYVADYQMRAMVPGLYHAMPAQVFGMYDPTLRATTAETEFEIR
ncbi:MAG: hypothetical protein N3B12_05060, partial [Armatimonadetes bacterium]|nr:hypothetical protein [Armatimonadota bacterium]